MQERRKKYEDNSRLAWDILEAGSARAREIAGATMDEVRKSMGLDYSLNYSLNSSLNSSPNPGADGEPGKGSTK
jgi:hypothetical protein